MEGNSLILLIIGQAVWLATSFLYPIALARQNHIEIDLNGSIDSLKKEWHRLNVILWVLALVPLAFLAVLPVAINEGMYFRALALYISMVVLSRAWHWHSFDLALNRFRKLDEGYIGENAESDLFLRKHPNAKRTALVVGVCLYICSVILLFI